MAIRGLDDVAGAEDVVAHPFANLRLDDRYVLVGGGMEDQARPVFDKRVLQRHAVTDVAEHCVQRQVREALAQFALDEVELELAALVDDQRGDPQARDLAAQFRADRATAARDEHRLPQQLALDAGPVELYGAASEQVVDRDLAHLAQAYAAGHEILQPRQCAERAAAALAELDDALHLGVCRGRNRDEDAVDLVAPRELRQARERAQYRNAMDSHAGEPRAVVDEADRHVVAIAQDVAHQHLTAAARTDDEDALAVADVVQVQAAVLREPVQQARAAEQEHEEDRIEHQHRTRDVLEARQHEQRERDAEGAEHGAPHDVPEILQAREAPQSAVEAEVPGDPALYEDHDRQRTQVRDQEFRRRQREIETRGQRDEPGQRDHDQIVRDDDGADIGQSHVRRRAVGGAGAGSWPIWYQLGRRPAARARARGPAAARPRPQGA